MRDDDDDDDDDDLLFMMSCYYKEKHKENPRTKYELCRVTTSDGKGMTANNFLRFQVAQIFFGLHQCLSRKKHTRQFW